MKTGLGKWCVYALLLLAPGSFLVLPLLWLIRRVRAANTVPIPLKEGT